MKDSILIFGGGENQVSLISTAKKIGYRTIVIDPNENAVGKKIADVFEVVAPKDKKRTLEIAKQFTVKGIVTCQMENPLLLMAEIAEEMNFIFPSIEQIKKSRNKFLMKQAFLENNVPCANGILFKKNDEITFSDLEEFVFPLIIKPIDAFSSRGVFRVNSFDEIKKYENITRSFSSSNEIIIEEFIDGQEFSVESVTFNEETHVIQITEKIVTAFPNTVELGHIQPANVADSQKKDITDIICKAIAALGLNNCASHSEIKLSQDGPKIIEVGARLGGDFITSHLVPLSTGISIEAANIEIAMGCIPEIEPEYEHGAAIIYLNLPVGKIVKSIGQWNELLNEPLINKISLSIKYGDVIQEITDSSKRPGYLIVSCKNKFDARKEANKYSNILKSYIELQ